MQNKISSGLTAVAAEHKGLLANLIDRAGINANRIESLASSTYDLDARIFGTYPTPAREPVSDPLDSGAISSLLLQLDRQSAALDRLSEFLDMLEKL